MCPLIEESKKIDYSAAVQKYKFLSKKFNDNVGLIHGNLDSVVTPDNLLDEKDFFIRNKIHCDTQMIDNCDHNIPLEASSMAINFIKENLNN